MLQLDLAMHRANGQNQDANKVKEKKVGFIRALVRAGATSAAAPINYEQWVRTSHL